MHGKSRPLSARLKMDSLNSGTSARPGDSASRVSNRRLMFSLDKAAAIIDDSRGRRQRLGAPQAVRIIQVSLKRSSAADVQGNAMRAAARHFGVPKFERDYIEVRLLDRSTHKR